MAEQKDLFTRLKKMFSTDVIVRNVGGKKIKIVDTDEIQYATDRNSLRDRFNRLRSSTYNLHNRDMSMAYQASRLELFRDYDVMDMDPIIASALDIYSDECLSGDTLVPLLDGRKMTIKDLYEENEKNFWVYSVDSDGKFVPQKCERVACNGTKQMFEIALDDGTKIKCTSNHMWVKSDGTIVTTENLKSGDSLKILSTKLSNSKFMPGYEMLLEDGKWQYTHRMVAARTAELIEQKVNMKSKNLVIHHNSFDKRNNCPDKLCWMDYTDHRKVHADFNKKLWSDPTKVHQYKQKTIDGQNRYWTEERRIEVSNRQRIYMNEMIHGMSADERKKMFGVCGSSNGMFNNGDKLSGNKNGRWKNFSTLDMIDIESYREDIIGGMTTSELRKKYNLSRKTCDFLDKNICIEFGCEQTKQIKPIIRKQVLESRGISVKKIKIAANNLLSSGVNVFRKNKILAQELNITVSELKDYVIASKYKGLRDLVLSNNHRVLSIKLIESEMAYDLVNVGETHIYAIETNDGSKLFTHNCLVPSEFGNVLTIRSKNENVKQILHNLFYDILNVEFNMWSWTRNMCKYGDFFLRLEISPEYGIYLVHPISPYEMTRVEGSDPKNLNYVKYQHDGAGGGMEYENFEIAHFRLLSDSNFLPYGKCLTANNYVETECGAKRINDIEIGEKVWTFNTDNKKFELSEVNNKVSSGVKEIIKVSTQHNQIECSKNHPVLVFENNNLVYKPAEELSLKDLLVLSTNSYKNSKVIKLNKKLITEDNHNGWKNNIDLLPDTVDEKFAQFFGFMIGDGWVNQGLNRVNFAAGIYEDLNKKYSDILTEYTGKDIKIINARSNSGEQRYIDSKLLAEFMKINGFDGNSHEKRIPCWVYELDENLQLAFIRGLVDADGSIFTDKWNINRYSIELNNQVLVEDIKHLLNRLNIKCSNVKSRGYDGETEICGVKCNRTKSYYIYFYLDGARKSQQNKYDLLKNESAMLVPITKIESVEDQETFDIQVLSNNSNFISNGIVVHNSMIEPARRVWKQLSLMEDAMLIHRIMRAPEKRMFYVDVGNIPPSEIDAAMQKIIGQVKKVPYIDERTGDYNLRFNLNNMVEDFYLPVRGGDSGTKIDTLPGMDFTGIDDLEYVRNKMMAALKIPKAFLGYDESISGKATLAAEDVRFARTISRIQRIIISELTKIAVVHLYVQGYTDASLVDFELELSNPSTIFEQEKLAIWQSKISLANDMMESNLFSKKWLYNNVFNMSGDDIESLQGDIIGDKKEGWRIQQITDEGSDPAASPDSGGGDVGGGDVGGGDVGGGDDSGLGDLGGGGGGESGGGGEDASELPPLEEENKSDQPTLDEETREERENGERPSQKGNKAKYTPHRVKMFGEDVLGYKENNEKSKSDHRITHMYRSSDGHKGSPLSLEEDLKNIKASLKARHNNKQKKVLTEEKSILDETNIIETDKAI
jgi:intein/homing endonuclease